MNGTEPERPDSISPLTLPAGNGEHEGMQAPTPSSGLESPLAGFRPENWIDPARTEGDRPPRAADLLAAVADAPLDRLPDMAVACWRSNLVREWYCALLVVRVQAESGSVTALAERMGVAPSTVTKLAAAGRVLLSRETEAERDECLTVSPYRLYEAARAAKGNGQDPVKLARSRHTDAKLAAMARSADPDQHHESGELRTFSVLVSAETLTRIRQAMNGVRHQLGVPHPSDSEVMDRWTADFLSGFAPGQISARKTERLDWLLNVARAVWDARGKGYNSSEVAEAIDGLLATGWHPQYAEPFGGLDPDPLPPQAEDVLAGRVRSIESGAWWPLQRDHAIPRGHKVRKRAQNDNGDWADVIAPNGEPEMWHPDDPEWPCVWLTPEEHRIKTQNEEGTWRERVATWSKRYPWFAEKVQRFLGDRRLEEV